MENSGLTILSVQICDELKELFGRKADSEGESLTDRVARLIAEDVGEPQLAKKGRRRAGRPRTRVSAA